ncbi:LamG domain-containing protein [Lunatimonas salinarum]|uniref:LamG domain-containing protein n=1 Tax=Lunatimonas salinarum TaxID=1774590 RepID=UPI001FD7AF2A|nr:LamG domain-containing protein [Lunatimonas salinarum]
MKDLLLLVFMAALWLPFGAHAQSKVIERHLLAFWDFSEEAGSPRVSKSYQNDETYHLLEGAGPIEKVSEGPIHNSSAYIVDSTWFYIPRGKLGKLNIYGKEAAVTVVAWVKKDSEKYWQAIGGVWDETREKRQYYLFLNAASKTHHDEMKRYPTNGRIHGHISALGGKSPGEKAWISYVSSDEEVAAGVWTMIAITYDGKQIRAYKDGLLSANPLTNPFPYEEGIFDGGEDGADFTVGANSVIGKMTNQFIGQISGLAVFDRALNEREMRYLFRKGIDL